MTALQNKKLIVPSFALALLVLLLIGVGAHRQGMENARAAQWVSQTFEVRGELNATLSLMQDVETGSRGYLLTGQDSYLEPFNNATAQIEPTIQNLRRLTADNPEQQSRLDARGFIEASRWVAHTQEVLTGLDGVIAAETGMRDAGADA